MKTLLMDLGDSSIYKNIMGIHAKKSLGQHFLRSKDVVQKIVESAQIFPGDVVVEVGPGEGVLTNELLNEGARVVAIEKDARLIPLLTDRFADAIRDQHLILIEGDVLEKKTAEELFDGILSEIPEYKVVANIPYYITGMLFRYFLETHRQPTLLTFLIQKEVAEQIVSHHKKESILSLSVKAFGDPVYGGKVGKESFDPVPKVDSAIITVGHISRERLGTLSDEKYFRVVKAGFASRRKMLLGNLVKGLDVSKEKLEALFIQLDIPHQIRGEDLPFAQWIALAQKIQGK